MDQQQEVLCCETHKQQIPPFIALKEIQATFLNSHVLLCSASNDHGLANKFCTECKQVLCPNCAFAHFEHGVREIKPLQAEWNTRLDEKLSNMKLRLDFANKVKAKAKVLINELNEV